MHTEAQYSALNGLALKAKDKLKGIRHTQTKLITEVLKPFTEQAKLLNFSHTDLLVQIGRINRQLTDRRCD
tara:strand:+ start:1301 stop:1513 length:213 start_codon:yes stop_codon:yes gene_type:complete